MRTGKPPSKAGGPAAVFSTIKHITAAMPPLRGARALLLMNQRAGFDCPGCAWPEARTRGFAEFCENGAKAIAEEATTQVADRELFATRSIAELAGESDFTIGKLGRLAEPMIKREGRTQYEPVSWGEAFELIAHELRGLKTPDEAIFYTSGRTSNEAAFLYQLLVRRYGTNNLPDCSNMCHESSGVALTEVIGVGKGTVTLEDFELADCIVVIGQNPGTNHPRMLSALQKAARNSAQIISINPLREAGLNRFKNPQELRGWVGSGTPLASLHLPVRIGGDVALLKGLMKGMIDGVIDRDFISQHTDGFESFLADLKQESWDRIVEESGISREEIESTSRVLGASKRLIFCWAMGLTQHPNAVGNIQSIVNLLMLGGHLGRPGAGACPVRGHSNVQGDRTMGIYEKPSAHFLDALEREFGFKAPRKHGVDTVEAIRAMDEGKAKVFFAMGGNFLSATPDTEVVSRALSRCELTVHVSTKLNRSHLSPGKKALILPCLGRTDVDLQASGPQFVTVENSMGIVHSSRGRLTPISNSLKSEAAIVAGLGELLYPDMSWSVMVADYDRIRERIARVIPGFEKFPEKARTPGGFYLPNAVRDSRTFNTSTGKARFTVHPIPRSALPRGRYRLMTIRSHDQFNTTIYGLNDRYRGIESGRHVLFAHPEDLRELGFAAGTAVDITSHFKGETRTAKKFALVPYEIPRGCMAAYFPEANVLVPLGSVAEKSNTPAYKSIEVSLERSQ